MFLVFDQSDKGIIFGAINDLKYVEGAPGVDQTFSFQLLMTFCEVYED